MIGDQRRRHIGGSRVVRDWGWAPKFDNLDVMIEGALAWERSLREGEKTV